MVDVKVSLGELIDKLSILDIKQKKIKDSVKLQHVKKEYILLYDLASKYLVNDEVEALYIKLITINSELWDIEDEIRKCEQNKNFDFNFIELARKVYFTNDSRFEIKNKINSLTNSEIVEVKDYVDYKSVQ